LFLGLALGWLTSRRRIRFYSKASRRILGRYGGCHAEADMARVTGRNVVLVLMESVAELHERQKEITRASRESERIMGKMARAVHGIADRLQDHERRLRDLQTSSA
jgi:hypothetical protein